MYHQPKPIRVFIVALLALSTSVAVICTPVSAQSLGPGKESKAFRRTCCCGTPDGRCCGMGCCLRQPSNQIPTDPPLRTTSEKDKSHVLVLVFATCEVSAADCCTFHNGARSGLGGSLAAGTLQSQHIRIQT
jgi:hypothetical protein